MLRKTLTFLTRNIRDIHKYTRAAKDTIPPETPKQDEKINNEQAVN